MTQAPNQELKKKILAKLTGPTLCALQNIFSGPDDPNYAVCKITPYRIEYQSMSMVPPEVWEA